MPATLSRNCPASPCSAARRFSLRAFVWLPTTAMNTGTSGRVTRMMAAATRSRAPTATITITGTTTARTTCGRKRPTKGSRGSSPPGAKAPPPALRREPSQAGPSRTTCPRNARRRSEVTVAAARSADTSIDQAVTARAAITTKSTTSGPRSTRAGSWESTAAATTEATSQACATRSSAVTRPKPAVTSTDARTALDRSDNLRAGADIGPPGHPGGATDALAVLDKREVPLVGVREDVVHHPVQQPQLLGHRCPVLRTHGALEVHEERSQPPAHLG